MDRMQAYEGQTAFRRILALAQTERTRTLQPGNNPARLTPASAEEPSRRAGGGLQKCYIKGPPLADTVNKEAKLPSQDSNSTKTDFCHEP